MTTFRPTPKQAEALETRGCRHRFRTIKRAKRDKSGQLVRQTITDRHGNPSSNLVFGQPVAICEITDTVTKKIIASGEASNHEEAFAIALGNLADAPRPRTPAEVEAENASLKRRLAELEGKRADNGIAPEVSPEAPTEPPTEPEHEPVDLDGLRQEAEMLGIEVDGRWGEKRLRAEIQKAESEGQAEIQSKL